MRTGSDRSPNDDPFEEPGPRKISVIRKILLVIFFIAFWVIYYWYQGS